MGQANPIIALPSSCLIHAKIHKPLNSLYLSRRRYLSRANVRELELIGQEVGGTCFIEIQLEDRVHNLISCFIGQKEQRSIVAIVAVNALKPSCLSVPLVSNGEVEFIISIIDALDFDGFPAAEVYDHQGL
jgi:hypothetical protein